MATVAMIFSVCCATASAASTGLKRESAKPTQIVQDGIYMDVHGKETKLKHSIVDLKPTDIKRTIVDDLEVPMPASMLQNGVCEDVASEHTGFDVNDDNGFVKHASCDDLENHCHEEAIGEQVRVACPVSCFICTPGTTDGEEDQWHGPCFDAAHTGIRFRDGPKANCDTLINYCNHTSIGSQVREACKLSCGLCAIHVEGPYMDAYGNCEDLQSHEEPQFTISGSLAGCSDVLQFCQSHPDSYLIRHKCPLTCGVCGNAPSTTSLPDESDKVTGDIGGCDRRRRFGFCSSRRRRNL